MRVHAEIDHVQRQRDYAQSHKAAVLVAARLEHIDDRTAAQIAYRDYRPHRHSHQRKVTGTHSRRHGLYMPYAKSGRYKRTGEVDHGHAYAQHRKLCLMRNRRKRYKTHHEYVYYHGDCAHGHEQLLALSKAFQQQRREHLRHVCGNADHAHRTYEAVVRVHQQKQSRIETAADQVGDYIGRIVRYDQAGAILAHALARRVPTGY